jgi:hypothetical protein
VTRSQYSLSDLKLFVSYPLDKFVTRPKQNVIMMEYLIGLCIVESYVYFYFETERKSPDFVLAVRYGVGRDVAQAVSRWRLAMNAPVPAQRSPCGICDGQIGTRTGISKLFCFPCQCHSTVAQYSYISCGMNNSLLVAAVQGHRVTTSKWATTTYVVTLYVLQLCTVHYNILLFSTANIFATVHTLLTSHFSCMSSSRTSVISDVNFLSKIALVFPPFSVHLFSQYRNS